MAAKRSTGLILSNVLLLLLMFVVLPVILVSHQLVVRESFRNFATGLTESSLNNGARLLQSYLLDRLATVTDPEIERGERAEVRWWKGETVVRGDVPGSLGDTVEVVLDRWSTFPWKREEISDQEMNWKVLGDRYEIDGQEWWLNARLIAGETDTVFQGTLTPAELYYETLIFDWYSDFLTTSNGRWLGLRGYEDLLLIRVVPRQGNGEPFDLFRGARVDEYSDRPDFQLVEISYGSPHRIEMSACFREDLGMQRVFDTVWYIIYALYAILVAVIIAQQIRIRRIQKNA